MAVWEIWFFFGVASGLAIILIFVFALTNAGEMFGAAKRFNEVMENLTEKRSITQGQATMYLGNAIITAASVLGGLYFLATFIEALPSVVMLMGDWS